MEIKIAAKDVQPDDEIKTSDGYVKVGGVQHLSETRVGLLTPLGLIGVDGEDLVTVRRK